MKFLHTSDLHIGKCVHGVSMIDDQKGILDEIIEKSKDVDAVLIAGDIYDKSMPSSQAVQVVDKFLLNLSLLEKPIFITSGNHDSPERISYGASFMKQKNVYVTLPFNGQLQKISIDDTDIYMLPYIKPYMLKSIDEYNDEDITDYDSAVRVVINHSNIDKSRLNILVCHQFVAGFQPSDSESVSLGGIDNVTATAFDDFDYVALGHVHTPQKIMRDTLRYSGSPLKYSKSEAKGKKSVVIADIKSKDDITVELSELHPKHDMVAVSGSFDEIINNPYTEDYVFVALTKGETPFDPVAKLRTVYPNLLGFESKSLSGDFKEYEITNSEEYEKKSPYEYFDSFFSVATGEKMNEVQSKIIDKILKEVDQ